MPELGGALQDPAVQEPCRPQRLHRQLVPTQRDGHGCILLLPRAGKPPLEEKEEKRANPHALTGPDGNEGPKINQAEAQVRVSSVGILRLGASSACQRLYRAPRFSVVLASHQQPWEEGSALPKLSLFPSGTRLQHQQLGD